jgi:hypothetical protein
MSGLSRVNVDMWTKEMEGAIPIQGNSFTMTHKFKKVQMSIGKREP